MLTDNAESYDGRSGASNDSCADVDADRDLTAAVLAAIPHGIAVFDARLRLITFNCCFARMIRGGVDSLNKDVGLGDVLNWFTPDQGDVVAVDLDSLLSRRGTLPLTQRTLHDGRVVDLRTNPAPDGGVILVATDVTELNQRTKRENRLLDAVAVAPVAMMVLDSDDRVVFWNEAYLALSPLGSLEQGMTLEQLLLCFVTDGDMWNPGNDSRRMVEARLQLHRNYSGPFEEATPAGGWMLTSEYRTSDGGTIVTHVDITERKHAELMLRDARDEAYRASRAKSAFIANMSHELRTPLNAVLGFSEIIRDQLLGPIGEQKYADYASDIYEGGRLLLDMINALLDLSKIEAGQFELADEPVEVMREAAHALRLVGMRAERAGVSTELAVPADLPLVRADPRAVKQMFLNLLSNAVKFTPRGGHVSVSAEVHDGRMAVSVADSGIGIAPEDLEVALTPFGQVHRVARDGSVGTGLGLPLVKSLIEQHDGRLVIDSEVGVGTRVTLWFPRDRLISS